jgi:hypothetical protein
MDIMTEVALAAIATRIIWSLQISTPKKAGVAFAFLQRLAIIAPIITHLHYLKVGYHSDDPSLRNTNATICKQAEIAFAIVAASVPCLRPFLTATATHYGAPAEGAKSSQGQYANTAGSSKLSSKLHSNQGGAVISLQNLNLSKKESSINYSSSGNERVEGMFLSRSKSQVTAGGRNPKPRDATSVESDDSRGMIIRKDVQYDVQFYDDTMGTPNGHEHGHTV